MRHHRPPLYEPVAPFYTGLGNAFLILGAVAAACVAIWLTIT